MPIRSSPGAILPRDMDARQWATFIGDQRAQYYREGQDGWDDGTGFWLGVDTDGVPKFSIGDSGGSKLTWNGTTLAISGDVNLTNTAESFAPTWVAGDWSGSAPSGSLHYINFGAYALLWRTGSDLTATSDSNTMSFSDLPAEICPLGDVLLTSLIIDNSGLWLGQVSITEAGVVGFTKLAVSGSYIQGGVGNTFTTSGTKGIPEGWLVVYPLPLAVP